MTIKWKPRNSLMCTKLSEDNLVMNDCVLSDHWVTLWCTCIIFIWDQPVMGFTVWQQKKCKVLYNSRQNYSGFTAAWWESQNTQAWRQGVPFVRVSKPPSIYKAHATKYYTPLSRTPNTHHAHTTNTEHQYHAHQALTTHTPQTLDTKHTTSCTTLRHSLNT